VRKIVNHARENNLALNALSIKERDFFRGSAMGPVK
jgi:hypothetical protein